jgi:tetratricopeptide (TPR) repeat protein
MSHLSRVLSTCISPMVLCAWFLTARAEDKAAANNGSLQQHYDSAQELQRVGKLTGAAEEYRAFLGQALGELATGYGLGGDYQIAGPLFEEALILEPDWPSLLLDSSRTALMLGDSARAESLANRFLAKYPGNREQAAQAHQLLGRALLKANRDREARKELETAVALDPTFPNGYDLAVACLDLDDEGCAAKIFEEMEKSFGDTPEIHMAFGRAYADSDFQPRAVAEFEHALEENPHLPGAHYLLAAVLLATGDDEGHAKAAGEELRKELAVSPRDAATYAALGKLAITRNDYHEAETYLKKATSLDSQSPDAYLYLGQVYVNTQRSAEAEAALRECVRLTTDVSRNRYQVQKAHFLLGRILLQKGKPDAAHVEMDIARDLNNKILSLDRRKLAGLMDTSLPQTNQAVEPKAATAPGSRTPAADPRVLDRTAAIREQLKLPIADSYNNLGAIAATNHDYPDAITYFEQASAWNPLLDGLDYNWGRAAFAGLRFGDAVPPLSRYVKAHPDDIGARSVLAISQFMTGNYHGCIEALQPYIGKLEIDPQVETVYAESMVRTGQITAGIALLDGIEKLHPEIPEVHRSLGEALGQSGDKQRAIAELSTAVQLNPRDADAHYDLGKMDLDIGDIATGVSELEEAARLSPNNEGFHQELAAAYTAAFRPADAQKETDAYNFLRSQALSNASSPRATAQQR